MKKAWILMLCMGSSVFAAETRELPPVIDNSTYLNGSSGSRKTNSRGHSTFDMMARMEQMQKELQELRGIIEEQSQTVDDLKNRQTKIYSDLDQRLQDLTQGEVDNNSLEVEAPSNLNEPVVDNGGIEQSVTNYSNSEQNLELNDEEPKNQKETYQEAFETLRNGHNTRAIEKFKTLLNQYPNGAFAANSQYWLGEAYRLNNDSKSAIRAFSNVLVHYSDSSKTSDALFKLGALALERNQKTKAKEYLMRVIAEYPNSSSARLAQKKMNTMGVFQP